MRIHYEKNYWHCKFTKTKGVVTKFGVIRFMNPNNMNLPNTAHIVGVRFTTRQSTLAYLRTFSFKCGFEAFKLASFNRTAQALH